MPHPMPVALSHPLTLAPPATPRRYIMTSPATHAATVSFFQRHKHFGLSPRQVTIFSHAQRAPLLSEDLKIISENPVKVSAG